MDSYEGFLKDVSRFAESLEKQDLSAGIEQGNQWGDIGVGVGERVKQVREKKGLSLEDIYKRTDIDITLLSQIEEGAVSPPLGTIIKLAKALEMKMGFFISGREEQAYTIVHREDRKPVSRYDAKRVKHYGYEYKSLAPHKKNRHMDPFLVTLEPSETDEERSSHDGQEFVFVLQGEMEVRLEEKIHVLGPGDAIYYDSMVPHLVKCHSDETTMILAVLYTENTLECRSLRCP
jgi:transcriptional regulator with XRE-family HTH domain